MFAAQLVQIFGLDFGVFLALLMFVVFMLLILTGYNVAYCFAGTALFFAFVGDMSNAFSFDTFDPETLSGQLPTNWARSLESSELLAVPLFVLMGAILERSGLAERLLNAFGLLMGSLRGGVAAAVIVVGTLLAAATGVVAATVIVMGLLSLPAMLRLNYNHQLATGAIVASGTLAQLLPPSIVLILLAQELGVGIIGLFAGALLPGLLLSGLYILYTLGISLLRPAVGPAMPIEQRKLEGNPSMRTALIIGGALGLIVFLVLLLIGLQVALVGAALTAVLSVLIVAPFSVGAEARRFGPIAAAVVVLLAGAAVTDWRTAVFAALLIFGVAQASLSTSKMLMAELLVSIVPILVLIVGVLVSIFQGVATPSESGAVGVFGALILAVLNYLFDRVLANDGAGHITPVWKLTRQTAVDAARSTANITILVMTLLFASLFFRLMFQELGGSDQVASWLSSIPGGKFGFVVIAMIAVFLLGINLEFLEITFIVVPIFVPAMAALGFTDQEIVWFAVLMAVNLNMAFISPPVGFSLFYLQSVAPDDVKTADIHKGALPFMGLQIVALVVLAVFPGITNFSYCFFNPNAPERFCDPNSNAGSNLFTVLAILALVTLVATIVMGFRQRRQGPPAVEEAATTTV
ncbi:MAG: TRAP transporter large permease subunit [Actinomycetota bacterium]